MLKPASATPVAAGEMPHGCSMGPMMMTSVYTIWMTKELEKSSTM